MTSPITGFKLPAQAPPSSPTPAAPPAVASAPPHQDKVELGAGIHSETLTDGTSLLKAANGLQVRNKAGNHELQLPTGEKIDWSDKTAPTPEGTSGKNSIDVKSYADGDGHVYGYSFDRPDGIKVSVNTKDMSVVYQDKSGSITQNIDAQGGEFIMASGPTQAAGAGKAAKIQVYISPDAQIHSLQGNPEGLLVSQSGLKCNTPQGKGTIDLPIALPFVPQGDLAAPAAAAPQASPSAPGTATTTHIAAAAYTPFPNEVVPIDPATGSPSTAQATPDYNPYTTQTGYPAPTAYNPAVPYNPAIQYGTNPALPYSPTAPYNPNAPYVPGAYTPGVAPYPGYTPPYNPAAPNGGMPYGYPQPSMNQQFTSMILQGAPPAVGGVGQINDYWSNFGRK